MDTEENRLHSFFSRLGALGRRIAPYFVWPNGSGIRAALAILFTLVVALFIHMREDTLFALQTGTRSPRHIVAEEAFSFPDAESTLRLKERAVRDVASLFWISKEQVKAVRAAFDRHWMQDRSIDRERIRELLFAGETLTEALIQARFTDVETLRKMESAGFDTTFLFRTPAAISEMEKQDPDSEGYTFRDAFWRSLSRAAFSSAQISDGVRNYIISFYSNHPWHLAKDHQLEMRLRDKLQKEVPPAKTTVRAGELIVGKGEMITERHADQLKALRLSRRTPESLWSPQIMFGSLLLAMAFSMGIYLFFNLRAPSVLASSKKLLLYGLIVTLALVIGRMTLAFLHHNPLQMIEGFYYPLFVPFAVILICVLMREMSIAIFSVGWLSVFFAFILPVHTQTFLLVNFIASLFCLFNVRGVRKRTEIFSMCFKAWMGCAVIVVALNCLYGQPLGIQTLYSLVSLAFFTGLTGILCIGLLPLLESLFEVMTNITLMEYIDPNNELLRRFSVEAPGTYQHSLLVANLAEAAATEIGANGTFCRVAAMYHDIGKVSSPQYFTENQQGINPHQLLTPEESAAVIMDHVTEGERLANEFNVPRSIINIIREHHGTTLVYFFYKKAVDREGGDKSKVDDSLFRYPGVKPRSKESAVLMIADTVEAAVHGVDDLGEVKLKKLVAQLVAQKAADGQFSHCQLTFEELSRIQQVLVKNVLLANKQRVQFPAPAAPPSEETAFRADS